MNKPKVVVVMPAYNAAKTLHITYAELPHDIVDLVILVDDGSSDETLRIARELKLPVLYLGVGEKAEDLVDFRPREFASALVG